MRMNWERCRTGCRMVESKLGIVGVWIAGRNMGLRCCSLGKHWMCRKRSSSLLVGPVVAAEAVASASAVSAPAGCA